MNANDAIRQNGTDIENRDARALTQYLTVIPIEGTGMYEVTSESGREYIVDLQETRCTCKDHEFRRVRCKHIRRVEFETGARELPAWINEDALPCDFRAHVDADDDDPDASGACAVATDGGLVAEEEPERPPNCKCTDGTYSTLPCFQCSRRGFETINPDAEG